MRAENTFCVCVAGGRGVLGFLIFLLFTSTMPGIIQAIKWMSKLKIHSTPVFDEERDVEVCINKYSFD